MGMAATKEVMTADSVICNACQRSFLVAISSGWRLTLKVFLASTAASIPPQGPARALATVTRSVYEALGRGEVVNSEDVERCLTEVRVSNGLDALGNRKIVRKVLMDVSKSVSDVCARDECSDNFGDDGQERDNDNETFLTWRKTMIQAAWSCADARVNDQVTCLEVVLRRQCARANATMEYWQGAFAESMPEVRFKGRGWNTETGQGDLSPETSVVLVLEHCIIDSNGKTKKQTCSCSRKLASTRKCRNCKCAKREKHCVAIACGCKGRCGRLAGGTVTPAPAPTSPDPDRAPTIYPSAGVSGESSDFNYDDRSERSVGDGENEDWECVSSSYDSDGWPDDTSSIQLGPEDVDLDEFFEDGV